MATPDSPVGTLPGVRIGHDTHEQGSTGVTVVLLPEGATAGVDVRGAAPGTRETDLLDPVNTVQGVDAFVLAGGSAFGLDAAGGVMHWLEEQGRGVPVGPVRVPIVAAAVIFDLGVGDPTIRPDAASGVRACAAAVPVAEAAEGCVGAGAGASVGKLLGMDRAMRGALGIATMQAHGITMTAVVVVNAVGDIVDPDNGELLAGARRSPDGLDLAGTVATVLGLPSTTAPSPAAPSPADPSPTAPSPTAPSPPDPRPTDPASAAPAPAASTAGANTTIGVLVTDARLTKAQANRLAQVAHDGLARTIRPVHTPMDGDTIFAAATGTVDPGIQGALPPEHLGLLMSVMAAEVTSQAVVRAIRSTVGWRTEILWLPAWRDGASR